MSGELRKKSRKILDLSSKTWYSILTMKHSLKNEIELRTKAVEESILWWEEKLEKAISEYEEAVESGDEQFLKKCQTEIKNLLRRAELEKIEMAKIESKINESCADAAFKGRYSVNSRKNKNG